MHKSALLLALSIWWCAILASGFDLGPYVRIAQCRSQCIREHSVDGSSDWYGSSRMDSQCSECWHYCEVVEFEWDKTKSMCEGDQLHRCPACQTACNFHKGRFAEEYLPSMLPAPRKGPVLLGKYDVAIVLRKVYKIWSVMEYYPGERVPTLRPDTWIIAVVEGGLQHYSWEEWVPRLDSLRQGPSFFEATISWTDVDDQLKRQQALEQKKFNDRVRQFFLERYGEKVLFEWRQDQESQIPEDVYKRFFFKRRTDENEGLPIDDNSRPSTGDTLRDVEDVPKETYVVSWEPETGGLMGNQVADSNSAQISLLPGVKYKVRIASNDGPGSFPIEIDTRPNSVQVVGIKKPDNTIILAVCAAVMSLSILVILAVLISFCRRRDPKLDDTV